MQIRYLNGQKFDIKAKDANIMLSDKLSINDFELPGAGEYEKNGVFVEGVLTNGDTVYIIRTEEMALCYLGKLSDVLKDDVIKEIGDVDILFVPLGEEGSIDVKKALALIGRIDPRIVIPMLYSDLSIAEFKKSEGITDGEIDILKIKRDDLPADERKNIILAVS